MAASTLSLGMLMARAFCTWRRSAGLELTSPPPALTAMLMSLEMRANCLAMRSQRANIVCLRTSNMRPIGRGFSQENVGKGTLLGDVANRNRHVAHVGVTGGMDIPGVAPVAARLDVPGEKRCVGTQHLEGEAFGFGQVGR